MRRLAAALVRCAKYIFGPASGDLDDPRFVVPPTGYQFAVGDRVFTSKGVGIIFAIQGPDSVYGDLGMPYHVGFRDGTEDTLNACDIYQVSSNRLM